MLKDSKFFKSLSKIHWMVWLTLIIAIALIRLVYIFSLRDGHHVDETWSYGFANSYYCPNVFGDFNNSMFDVTGKWIDGKIFKDYITVSEEERFSFDSVYFNKREDLSPPFYAVLLHFVCSLFPDTFSWTYAFVISLVFYIPSLILIYLNSHDLTGSKKCGFATLIYFIFSGCGTACFLYLRLYHMLTFFTLWLMWLMMRIYSSKDEQLFKYYLFLPIVTVLGTMTHYYFLIIAFFFTFFSGVFLLFRKNIIRAFRVCYVMLLSVLLFFNLHPVSIIKLTPFFGGKHGTEGHSFPYSWNLRVAFMHSLYGTVGFFVDVIVQDVILALGFIMLGALIILLLCFLFRNEKWMLSLRKSLKKCFMRSVDFLRKIFKSANSFCIIALLSAFSFVLIIPFSASLFNMGYVERYFFPVMSVLIIIYLSFVYYVIGTIIDVLHKPGYFSRSVVILISLFILILQCCRSNILVEEFKFRTMGEHELKELVSGKDCFIYTDSIRDLNWLSTVLYETDQIYIDYLYQHKYGGEHIIPELDRECVLLIVDNGFVTVEQKEAMENGEDFELTGFKNPKQMITEDEYIADIEDHSGNRYHCIGSFGTFVGDIKIYECR